MSFDLSDSLVKEILIYLGSPIQAPTLRYLNRLIHAYIRRVPWESVSRIVKRHTMQNTKDCPRLPEEFWSEVMRYGFGGTCFESSFAFYSLLMALGYEGYLTVNDMGASRGCHAAEAIATITAELKSAYVQVKISRPAEITSLRRAGYQVAHPSWDAFMIKPLAPEVTGEDAHRLFGIGTDRFLISWLDIT